MEREVGVVVETEVDAEVEKEVGVDNLTLFLDSLGHPPLLLKQICDVHKAKTMEQNIYKK